MTEIQGKLILVRVSEGLSYRESTVYYHDFPQQRLAFYKKPYSVKFTF